MRDASVGFQCPQCVAEGRKSTRTGRTAYGGLRPTNAGITSIVLIAINAAVFLLIQATGGAASSWFYRLALLPSGVCASKQHPGGIYPLTSERTCALGTNPPHDGQWFPGVSDGAWWQLMTSAFTHVEVWHIGFNMLALWFLGPQLEQAIGRARFLALYLISALAGSTMAYWFAPVHGETLGASGAIFGLMGALLVLALKVKANPQQILMWIGINFLFTVVVPNISWQGHLGGFLGGVLITGVLVYAPRERRTLWQTLGLGALTLALLAAVALRTAVLA
jgi:membrane associated rhomboid family serine protease